MNIVIQLLAELAEKDIRLWLEDGKLKFSAPEGAMTANVRDRIVGNKPAIIEFLGQAQKQQVVQIPHLDRTTRLPASFAQQRLWFLNRLEPSSSAYNMAGALRLRGTLAIEALNRAFNEIIARHEVLRTGFVEDDAGLTLVIAPAQPIALTAQALPTGLTASNGTGMIDDVVLTLAQREASAPFDLTRDRVLRITLFRIADNDHLLLTTLHHIASDGWSMGLLVAELTTLYRAFCRNEPSPLPELTLQYADFASWQHGWLSGERLEKQLQFWRTTLADVPALQLPSDVAMHLRTQPGGDSLDFTIDHSIAAALNELARSHNATLFMVLMAAFRLLLARYSGQSDFAIGTPVAGRALAQLEPLIGCFVNTLAIRSNCQTAAPFEQYLAAEKNACQAAFDHQDVPFEQVVDAMQLPRDMTVSPLFQVMFVLQNSVQGNPTMDLPGLAITPVEAARTASMFDLKLSISEQPQHLLASFEYRADLWQRSNIEQLSNAFTTLLRAITTTNPTTSAGVLPLLTHETQAQLLRQLSGEAVDIAAVSIKQLIEQQVQRTPDAIAVIDGDQPLTFAELNRNANRLAHHLLCSGVGAGGFAGICLAGSAQALTAVVAVIKCGAAYVPMDVTYPAERLRHMVRDARMPLVITNAEFTAHFDGLLTLAVNTLDINQSALWQDQSPHDPAIDVEPSAPLYAVYTSGSTGLPKGALVSHRNEVNLLQWYLREYGFGGSDRFLIISALGFDLTQKNLLAPLVCGATVVFTGEDRYDPVITSKTIARHRATVINCAPSAFYPLCDQADTGQLASLRCVLFGGEPIRLELMRGWFRSGHCHAEIVNMYGPTECTDIACAFRIREPARYDADLVPIGRPNDNVMLLVLDAQQQLLPAGAIGELCIGGASVGLGYLNNAAMTAERFIDHALSHSKIYRTGDLVRLRNDGQLEFVSRIDGQIKIRGFRIEIGEIEAQLMHQNGVREAVVAVKSGPRGNDMLAAYFVGDAAPADLRDALRKTLPDYMVPAAVTRIEQVPLTPNGKVDRKALPAPDLSALAREFVAPRNALEQQIADVFSDILGVARVGAHDNFFELGGHSLLATQAVSRLGNLTARELPLRALFLDPTVAGIASALQQAGLSDLPSLQPAHSAPGTALPLSFAQQRLWLIDQITPGATLYNVPLAVKILGKPNIDALERSIAEVVRRHDSLHTYFITDANGEARQVVAPFEGWTLSQAPAASDPQQLRQQVFAFLAEPFRLDTAPLLRVQLLALPGGNEFILLACLHHIITDGWSQDVLLAEIAALYPAFAAGQASPLPELAIQYTDFALWQQQVAATGHYQKQLDYWKQQLAQAPVLQLPTDKLRPALLDARGRVLPFVLDRELAAQTKQLAQQHGATLYQLLLAVFQLLLARYSGQDDIVVGSPVANRQQAALEPLIGFFVNTLALRTQIDNAQPFTQLLSQVRSTTIDAYQHQDVPFEQLIDALRVPRDLSNTPLVQVMFLLVDGASATRLNQGAQLGDITLTNALDEALEEVPTKFDLSLSVSERDGELHGEVEYRSSLWHEDSMRAFSRHFETLLRAIVAEPARAVGEYPLLTPREMAALMATSGDSWNATQHALPDVNALHTLIEQQVQRTPNATAVSYDGAGLSYAELNRRANQLAQHLRELGVGPGALVGVCIERGLNMSLALLATLKAGAAYVPFDPTFPADRLGFMLEDTDVSVMLTASHLTDVLPAQPQHVLCLDRDSALWEQKPDGNPNAAVKPDHLFNVIFTSGSTGKPKGVMVPQIGIINRLLWMQDMYPLVAGDRVLQKTPYSFDVSVWELFWPLLVGAEIVYAKPEGHKDPDYLCALIQQERIDTLHFVPSMLGIFLQNEHVSACTSIKRVFCSGEALQLAHEKRFFEKLPQAELHNLYGPTEASVDVSYYACSANSPYRSVPIGKPVWNTQLHVLDTKLQPVPVGVVGELYIGGIQLAQGYLKRDELTRNTFIDNPHHAAGHPSSKLYKSGDLARYLPDGNIEYIGRVDFQVKVRGLRIELGEIETVLMRHPLVKEAIVVVQDLGERNVIIVAYFVPQNPNVIPDAQTLRLFLKQDLPIYMLPNVYMPLAEIPLSANGKANRKALPAPDLSQMARSEYVAPRNELEHALADIFASALGMDKVGIHDNFFELGGHSLTATQITARLREQLQLQLDVRQVFETPTIAELAEQLQTQLQQQTLLIDSSDAGEDEEEFTF